VTTTKLVQSLSLYEAELVFIDVNVVWACSSLYGVLKLGMAVNGVHREFIMAQGLLLGVTEKVNIVFIASTFNLNSNELQRGTQFLH
jgi:hypothetical protein